MTQDEFMKLMEVQINKAEEKARQKAFYDLGVAKMKESWGVENG
jgi:hypothetical protein